MKLSTLSLAVVLVAGPVLAVAQDMDTSFQSLKDAVAKEDVASVKKLAAEVCAMARQAAAETAPQGEDEKKAWAERQTYAHDVETYTEYALYAVAAKSPAATQVDLIATLEQQNPKSKYLDQAYGLYLVALQQTGAAAKVPTVAEKGLQNFPENEDLLMVMADHAMNQKQTDRALGFANRLVAAASKHSKPEGMAQADYDRKKSLALGRGYWIAGVIQGERNQYAVANKDLRAALPLIQGNAAMAAPALFYLGVSNYNLGKMTNNKALVLEGAKFSDQCAALPGPLAEQAWKNSAAMKADAAKMR